MNPYFDFVSLAWDRLEYDNNLSAAHRSLLWSIVHRWNKNFFKEFEATKDDLMKLSGIRAENTYFLLLSELVKYGYIEFQKGKSRVRKSTININTAKYEKVKSATTAKFAGVKPMTTAKIEGVEPVTTAKIEVVKPMTTAKIEVVEPVTTANFEGVYNIGKDSISSNSTKLKTTKINNDNIIIINSEGEIEKSAAQPNYLEQKMKARRVEEVATTFLDSEVGTLEGVTAHINGSMFPTADPEYYFNAVRDWRDKATGLPPLRPDWKLVINLFIRNDLSRNGKIITKNHAKPNYRHLDRNSPEFIQAEFKEIDYNIKRFLAARNRNGAGN